MAVTQPGGITPGPPGGRRRGRLAAGQQPGAAKAEGARRARPMSEQPVLQGCEFRPQPRQARDYHALKVSNTQHDIITFSPGPMRACAHARAAIRLPAAPGGDEGLIRIISVRRGDEGNYHHPPTSPVAVMCLKLCVVLFVIKPLRIRGPLISFSSWSGLRTLRGSPGATCHVIVCSVTPA